MIVIHGKEYSREVRGWNFFSCPRCQCIQLFLVEAHVQKSHLYYIDLPDVVLGDVITCDFCDASFQMPQEQEIQFNREWSRSELIKALEKSSSIEAKRVIKKDAWSKEELVAALTSIHEKGSMGKINTIVGFFIGAIFGIIIFVSIVFLGFKVGFKFVNADEFGNTFLAIIGGIFVGGTIGSIYSLIQQARVIRQKALADFIAKHNVPFKHIKYAAISASSKIRNIISIYENENQKYKSSTTK